MNNVLILGYFGHQSDQLDGQTVKTRSISELIQIKVGNQIRSSNFDTEALQKSKLRYFQLVKEIIRADIILYIPGRNSLKKFFIPLFIFTRLFSKELHFVVVGGWLSDYLMDKKFHRYCFSKIEGIYPQTSILTRDLHEIHSLKNVFQLPNFRLHNFTPEAREAAPFLNLIFMARVHPQKGLNTIFSLAKRLDNINAKIDVFGPIHEPYKEEFLQQIESSDNILYKGVVQPKNIYRTINQYDLMLFPTEFYHEGFPGSVLDAFIAGVPVIASEWQFSHEFIDNDVNGIVVPFLDRDSFIETVLRIVGDNEKINKMRRAVMEKRESYSAEHGWAVIQKHILPDNKILSK